MLFHTCVQYISSRSKGNILNFTSPATSRTPKADVPQHLPLPLQTGASHVTYFLRGVLRHLFGVLLGCCLGAGRDLGCCISTAGSSSRFVRAPRCSLAPRFCLPMRSPPKFFGGGVRAHQVCGSDRLMYMDTYIYMVCVCVYIYMPLPPPPRSQGPPRPFPPEGTPTEDLPPEGTAPPFLGPASHNAASRAGGSAPLRTPGCGRRVSAEHRGAPRSPRRQVSGAPPPPALRASSATLGRLCDILFHFI